MREVELKAVVAEVDKLKAKIDALGAKLEFEGALIDRRYDTDDDALKARDEVIRVRVYRSSAGERALLDWKGPADSQSGYKVREEISTELSDLGALTNILSRLGYVVVREIDRRILQYELDGAVIRFETYPRMDSLVEVEGEPDAIENAIAALGMARGEFTSEALSAFVDRFEKRTGVRAAISDRELAGDYSVTERE